MQEEIIDEEDAIAEERAHDAGRLSAMILNQAVRELSTLKPPICVAPETSIRVAVDEMNRDKVGCVLVVENERLVGIFTERDVLLKAFRGDVNIDATPVRDLMTRNPEGLAPDDRVSYALNKMSVGGYRHVPLVDEDERPVGVVAMRNVVDCLVDLFRQEVLNLPPSSRRVGHEREGA